MVFKRDTSRRSNPEDAGIRRALSRLRCPGGSGRHCRSGIHAFRTEWLARHQPPPAPRWHSLWGDWAVLGEVALWVKVVEHEDGYRAEHAMVQRLVVPMRLVIRVRLRSEFLCCLQVDDDVIDADTTEHTPEPGMAEALARVYGVDVVLGPLVTCVHDG